VLLNYRIGKYLFKSQNFIFRHIGLYYKTRLIIKRHCDISYNASIGKNLRMPHPVGIVIGEGVVIKDDVVIFQQVTLGSDGKNKAHKIYPVIENGVKIYAGAKIIGGVKIGKKAVIGANSVVNINVPSKAIAVGIPCRIIQKSV
jgi:serine O-acetyltransferase